MERQERLAKVYSSCLFLCAKANDNMKAAVRKHDGDSVRFEGTKGAEIVLMDYGSW